MSLINTKPQSPNSNSDLHAEFAGQMLRGMFDDNVWLAGRMLDIGDTASARRMLESALMQIDQIAMTAGAKLQSPKTQTPKTTEAIEV